MDNLSLKINKYYSDLKSQAEIRANNNLEYALSFPLFKKAYYEYKTTEFELATAEINSQKIKIKNLNEKLLILKNEKTEALKNIGLKPDDLEPKYHCPLCKDTGYIGQKRCECYKNIINNFSLTEVGIDLKTLPDFSKDTLIKNKNLENIYKLMYKFVFKYPDTEKKNIIFMGKTGVSKTYLASCVANEIAKKGYTTIFITFFELNNIFIGYNSIFKENRNEKMDIIMDCDFLVIDDFGASQTIKNITSEYLLALISERLLKGKTTLYTTNLTPTEILDKYKERIYSRMFNKKKCVSIMFECEDLRLDVKNLK